MSDNQNTAHHLPSHAVVIYSTILQEEPPEITLFPTYKEAQKYVKNIDPNMWDSNTYVAIYSLSNCFVPKAVMEEIPLKPTNITDDQSTSDDDGHVVLEDGRPRKVFEQTRPHDTLIHVSKGLMKNEKGGEVYNAFKECGAVKFLNVRYLQNHTGESFYLAVGGDTLIFIDQEKNLGTDIVRPDGRRSILQNTTIYPENFPYNKNFTYLCFVSPSKSPHRYNGYSVITEEDIWIIFNDH